MTNDNYYDILGLGAEAEDEDIEVAYQRELDLARGRDPARVELLHQARRVLLDPVERARLDEAIVGADLIAETVAAINDTLRAQRVVDATSRSR